MKRQFTKGTRYGKLTIISPTNKRSGGNIIYKCICDCGKECYVSSGNLGKSTNSCGCLAEVNKIKHNKSQTKLYDVWTNMKQRCNNPKNPRYKNYGGRGIKICDEWNDFNNFYTWANQNGYDEALNINKKQCTLDRIDVNGDYEPSNCRWISNKEQQNNKTDTVFYEYNGERHTISEWADLYNLPLGNLKSRISKGWDIKKILEQHINYINNVDYLIISDNNIQINNFKQFGISPEIRPNHRGDYPRVLEYGMGNIIINDRGFTNKPPQISYGICPTLRAENHGNLPKVICENDTV